MAKAFGVGQVWKVDITERYVSGAVKTATATLGDGTTVTRTGSQLQAAFGLKSKYVTSVDGNGGAAVPAPAAPAGPHRRPRRHPRLPLRPPRRSSSAPCRCSRPPRSAVTSGVSYKVVGVVRPAKAKLKAQRQKLVNGEWDDGRQGPHQREGPLPLRRAARRSRRPPAPTACSSCARAPWSA